MCCPHLDHEVFELFIGSSIVVLFFVEEPLDVVVGDVELVHRMLSARNPSIDSSERMSRSMLTHCASLNSCGSMSWSDLDLPLTIRLSCFEHDDTNGESFKRDCGNVITKGVFECHIISS